MSATAHRASRLIHAFLRSLNPRRSYTRKAIAAATARRLAVCTATAASPCPKAEPAAATPTDATATFGLPTWQTNATVGNERRAGTTISPAPCADAMRNDHPVRPPKPTCIPNHRCLIFLARSRTPKVISSPAQTQRTMRTSRKNPAPPASRATPAIERKCPRAMGGRAWKTARRSPVCSPRPTAKSHPIAGLTPWKAPSSATVNQGAAALTPRPPLPSSGRSPWSSLPSSIVREAIGIGGSVPALQPDLVRSEVPELDEEVGVEVDPTLGLDVELDQPPVDALRVELLVPRRVQRVREVDAPAVPADLHHLGPAVERAGGGMRRLSNDPADANGSCLLRVEGIPDVVLAHLAGSPAGDVQEPVVHREVDITHERGDGVERFEGRREDVRIRRLRRNRDDLLYLPTATVRAGLLVPVPHPDGGFEVRRIHHDTHEPVRLRRVVGGTQLEDDLMVLTEVDRLDVAPLPQVPEVQGMAVLVAQQQLGIEPSFDHVRGAPFRSEE